MKAEEIMQIIADLPNSERIKLLELLYDKHFDNRQPVEVILREKERSFRGEEDLYQQGYEEGVREVKVEVAKKNIARNPLSEIVEITELSWAEMFPVIEQYI